MKYQLILASASPRRKEILENLGVPFQVMPCFSEEISSEKEPTKLVVSLAKCKAKEVAETLKDTKGDYIIIGADTMVFHKKKALGKPKDEADAYQMLSSLSGKVHEVITGVSLIIMKQGEIDNYRFFSTITKVSVRELTDRDIKKYIATGEPMDKAGAYAIQGRFSIYIEKMEGDYFNVVGLPISDIYQALKEEGIDLLTLA